RPARGVPELPGTRRKILARLRRTFGLFVQMNTDLCLSVFICGFILFSLRSQKMREILGSFSPQVRSKTSNGFLGSLSGGSLLLIRLFVSTNMCANCIRISGTVWMAGGFRPARQDTPRLV